MRIKLIVALISGLAATSLKAGETSCANATADVRYYESTPDGGAPRPAIIRWTVHGQQYNGNSWDWLEEGLPSARGEFTEEVTLASEQRGTPGEGDASHTLNFAAKVRVVSTPAQGESIVLTETYLVCRREAYNGLPRP